MIRKSTVQAESDRDINSAHRQNNGVKLRADLLADYQDVRRQSLYLVSDLDIEDLNLQAIPEASPAKWHLAHTTWFFETFILSAYSDQYQIYNPAYAQLFNSYYNGIGEQYTRPLRHMLSRPTATEVIAYREYVDTYMHDWLESLDHDSLNKIKSLLILGLQHEQQHQELLLTDLLNAFSYNPLAPVLKQPLPAQKKPTPLSWCDFPGGITAIGKNAEDGFSFDNEGPRHRHLLNAYTLAERLTTNGEYLEFIKDDGYANPMLWHSDAWSWLQAGGIQAPGYWRRNKDQTQKWQQFSFSGWRSIDLNAPVSHVSWYEASAYANWANARLATESEWEHAMNNQAIIGQFADDDSWQPNASNTTNQSFSAAFGTLWEWTSSSYSAYPGYRPAAGALGEYNGKFMANQYVLRGGSCVTPANHIRPTYRNFFYPKDRWQFSGIRLAKDL